jgi:Gpi18-like mannosyltransferase
LTARTFGRAFWLILAAAILLRLALLPIPNTDNDFVFQSWSRRITMQGISGIYNVFDAARNPLTECQYPPGYLYAMWAVGKVYQGAFSPQYDPRTITLLMLLRVPTLLADLALAVLLYLALLRGAGGRAALLGFAAILFTPAMFLDATIVTQIDAVQSLLMVGSVLLLLGGRGSLSIAALALAALTKPQAAVLAPLVAVVVLRRDGWRAFLRGAAGAIAVFAVLSLPFVLNGKLPELFRTLLRPVGVSPYVSLNAYNFWWLVTGGNGWGLDTEALLGPVTYRAVGLLLLAAAVGTALVRVWRDTSSRTVLTAALWTTFSFFLLPTEMTERYVLVSIPLALLLAPASRAHRAFFVALAVTASINIYLIFPLVKIAPWDALQLPHSNFHWYLAPGRRALPVLAPWSETGARILSVVVALVHVAMLGFLGRLFLRGGKETAAPAASA